MLSSINNLLQSRESFLFPILNGDENPEEERRKTYPKYQPRCPKNWRKNIHLHGLL